MRPGLFRIPARLLHYWNIHKDGSATETGMRLATLERLIIKEKEEDGKMKAMDTAVDKPSYWQRVFLQSKVNGAAYTGEELPGRNWNWPKDTYLQRRLQREKWSQATSSSNLN
jgi:hypothetical protein